MFMEVKRTVRFLLQYFSANLQSAMEYRGAFISQIIFMFLNNLMLLFLKSCLRKLTPKWLSFQQILLLYAPAAGAYAFKPCSCRILSLSSTIAESADFYLTMPRPVLFHVRYPASAAAWGINFA